MGWVGLNPKSWAAGVRETGEGGRVGVAGWERLETRSGVWLFFFVLVDRAWFATASSVQPSLVGCLPPPPPNLSSFSQRTRGGQINSTRLNPSWRNHSVAWDFFSVKGAEDVGTWPRQDSMLSDDRNCCQYFSILLCPCLFLFLSLLNPVRVLPSIAKQRPNTPAGHALLLILALCPPVRAVEGGKGRRREETKRNATHVRWHTTGVSQPTSLLRMSGRPPGDPQPNDDGRESMCVPAWSSMQSRGEATASIPFIRRAGDGKHRPPIRHPRPSVLVATML